MGGVLTNWKGAIVAVLRVLVVEGEDRLGEGSVGIDFVGGDGSADVVGDEGRVAGGVDGDVCGAGSSGGDFAFFRQRAGLGIEVEGGDGRCGVSDGVDRVDGAPRVTGMRRGEGQVGWAGGFDSESGCG